MSLHGDFVVSLTPHTPNTQIFGTVKDFDLCFSHNEGYPTTKKWVALQQWMKSSKKQK